jgi:stage V sporulation protein R
MSLNQTSDKREYLSTDSDWTFALLEDYDREIARIAKGYGLETYPNQIEIISAEQMMDAYSSVGMPIGYNHWSYGKQFLATQKSYQRGQMGLAYEIVINSDPCIAYLMEENTMPMQALVIAHACYGHNSFFKGNYLFQTWTDASSIIDYLLFAKHYVRKCEERYGSEEVERVLDACHSLQNYGVDRYRRPRPISAAEEKLRQEEREDQMQRQINDLWRTLPTYNTDEVKNKQGKFPEEPQENLLYFLEKNAPILAPWQRELVRIVRKISQYFYPQRQTQVMNEGWATFWHYTLLNHLYDEGKVTDGFMMEVLSSHSNVVHQPSFDSPYYSGINPYALGFNMFRDIKRICENPTAEDYEWFPDIAGKDWLETLHFAMHNFKDESFVQQFLSPHLMREFHLFSLYDDDERSHYEIEAIHNDSGYRKVREMLARQYDLSVREPNIQVWSVDLQGDRSMTLRHTMQDGTPLSTDVHEVLKHLNYLWGFDIHLETYKDGKLMSKHSCPSMKVAD